ncbi:sensor histidine kinase [Streptomyces sp. TRM43335]|uniref:histidine kinase n=1 Tax=Streptomyces taklimakanensis TaxID=2569853 RepID=A0A6G2BBD8_9ACTN|nr:histidine kinase [Streptomyces taklimakanensis]MTE19389.1 sensor histidine kinase [Streptomyces taklimakanensis]
MTETGESVEARDRGRAHRGPLWWERRRSAVLDVVLALVSGVECGLQGVPFAREAGVPVGLSVGLGALAGLTLVLRRRWPIAVVLVSIAVTPTEMGVVLAVVSLYTLAASEVPRRIIALLSGMQALGTLIITLVSVRSDLAPEGYDHGSLRWFVPVLSLVLVLGVTAPPVLLGLYVGARRRLVESLRERADGLERELTLLADRAEERAEWARNEERTRIAREMHDVVAHRVSLMVVHAAALQAVALKDPEKASRNAALIGDMGRQALTELRTMLGVLRSHEVKPAVSGGSDGGGRETDGGVPEERPLARVAEVVGAAAAAGRGAARRSFDGGAGGPAPGPGEGDGSGPCLGDLEALVGQSRAAGMAVELSVEGEVRSYAWRVEQTAYRVVQEALTNVHKHAGGARTRVRLAHRAGEVAVSVENEAPVAGVRDAGLPSGGNGLVGMRERVTALGGGFVSGATESGGFRVSAVIPARG